MAIVERSMVTARHISITLETGNVYKILLKNDTNKRFACARNGYTANMYVGLESTIVDGVDDTLKIPVGEARQYVIPPLATEIYVSGQGVVEFDVSPIPLNFNIAPASTYARAVAGGYLGTPEQFDSALAGIDGLGTSISELSGYATTPLATYTVSGNKEVAVTAVDNSTGSFTAAGHGLANNAVISPVPNTGTGNIYPVNYYPNGLTFKLYYVVNATTNTFQISLTSGGAAVTFTTNVSQDLTKWHFEANVNNITITGLPTLSKCKLIIKGKNLISSNYVHPSGVTDYGQEWMEPGATTYGYGNIGSNADIAQYTEVIIDYTKILTIRVKSMTLKSNTAIANSVTAIDKILMSPKYSGGTYNSISLLAWYAFNGFAVEVYRA